MRRCATALSVCVILLLVLAAKPVRADEFPLAARSWSSAVLGAESWYVGALPPPGFHVIDYTLVYHAEEIRGRHGREVGTPPFTDFELTVVGNIVRPIYVSDMNILGANPAWHMVIPFIHETERSDFFHGEKTGVGDIYVSPLILGWHNPPWHYVAALDVITPTGSYNKHDLVNIGHNHWTFEPAFAVSYMGESGFTSSVKLMYDYHTEDHALGYKEGQQFHMDYNVGYAFGAQKQWLAGICGYFLTSLEEDRQHGHKIEGSREEALAIGPTVRYFKPPWQIELNAQQEIEAVDRPMGTEFWLKVIYSFGGPPPTPQS